MMKRHILLSTALLTVCFPLWCRTSSQGQDSEHTPSLSQRQKDSLSFIQTDWQWIPLAGGAEAGYASIDIFGSTQSISVVRYRASKFRTDIVSAPCSESSTTDSLALRSNALAAVNGSYFNVRTLEHATFLCHRGKVLSHTCPDELFRCDGVLALKKGCGHRIEVLPYDSTREETYCRRYKAAVVSGPVLVIDGRIRTQFDMKNKFFGRRHPRTFVGGTSDGWTYLVVIDGRFPGQGEGTTIPETVTIAAWFGLRNAINLDGGGSSTLWTARTGVVNHPYDNKKFDHEGLRVIPNIVGVYQ